MHMQAIGFIYKNIYRAIDTNQSNSQKEIIHNPKSDIRGSGDYKNTFNQKILPAKQQEFGKMHRKQPKYTLYNASQQEYAQTSSCRTA